MQLHLVTKVEKDTLQVRTSKAELIFTCFRQQKAVSLYFLSFFLHAEDTKLKISFDVAGSELTIAIWQDSQRADKAHNKASFPCQVS